MMGFLNQEISRKTAESEDKRQQKHNYTLRKLYFLLFSAVKGT
jgi:hypothetical protein